MSSPSPRPTSMQRLLWIAEQLATEAKMATNALACTARAQYQHAEVARLHIAIDLLKDELVGYKPIEDAVARATEPQAGRPVALAEGGDPSATGGE